MKAAANGRPAEQCRARMDWKPRAQVEAEGGDVSRRCARCRFVGIVRVLGRGGRPEHPYQCRYPVALGQEAILTRKTATCKHWEPRP